MDLEEQVLARLADGRWRLLDALAASIGASRREAEEAIENLRLAGHPIVGGNTGIKLTDDALELRAYAQSRRSRALQIARGTRALLHAANRLEGHAAGQKTLWKEVA